MTIHVLVPVHNRAEFTDQFLASVREQQCSESVRVLVVDDGSTDRTSAIARSHGADVLTGDGSWWWAGSVQRGLRRLSSVMSVGDFVYFGNNDTVLAPGHFEALLNVVHEHPGSLVGSVSNEIWPDGTVNPVSAGFFIDPTTLTVENAALDVRENLDALAGRGVLIPASAARSMKMSPRRMPQHFADLAATWHLRVQGHPLRVAEAAVSTQLERAGSSVEITPSLASAFNKRSSIYVPAMWSFWWDVSTPAQRITLPARFLRRGFNQVKSGAYA